jgi:hypothetical protein
MQTPEFEQRVTRAGEGLIREEAMVSSTPTNHQRTNETPTGELLRSLLADIRLVLEREADLARLELTDKGGRLRSAGGLLAGAVVAALLALGTLTASAVLVLARTLPAWVAAMVVGAVLVIGALVLFVVGRSRVRSVGPLAPTGTIQTAREDVAWMRRETERLRTTGSS